MKLDLDKLEALARAATPGPWLRPSPWTGSIIRDDRIVSRVNGESVFDGAPCGYENSSLMAKSVDIDYLEAVSPDVVLELIAELRRNTSECGCTIGKWGGVLPCFTHSR